MSLFRNWATFGCLTLCYVLTGCGGGNDAYKTAEEVKKERPNPVKKEHDHGHDEHDHHHHAPHHGSLTLVGDHAAQIELTLDAEAGKLELYVLDGEAEKGLEVDQAELELAATLPDNPDVLALKLVPIDPAKKDSGFVVQDDKLKGIKALKATITSLKLKDSPQEKVAVEFDAKKAEEEAHEAHEHGHEAHDDKKADAHKDEHKDDKDHKEEHKDDHPAEKDAKKT